MADRCCMCVFLNTPTTRMDSRTAQRCLTLLRAREAGTLKTALSALSFLRQNDAQVLPGEISIERLSQVMCGLCASVKLCKQCKGFQYLETCIFFCRMGTCPHELCARYLQQDLDVSMASLTKWPHTRQPRSMRPSAFIQLP